MRENYYKFPRKDEESFDQDEISLRALLGLDPDNSASGRATSRTRAMKNSENMKRGQILILLLDDARGCIYNIRYWTSGDVRNESWVPLHHEFEVADRMLFQLFWIPNRHRILPILDTQLPRKSLLEPMWMTKVP